eukprot:33066-Pyramimonas_sp.AAC.3
MNPPPVTMNPPPVTMNPPPVTMHPPLGSRHSSRRRRTIASIAWCTSATLWLRRAPIGRRLTCPSAPSTPAGARRWCATTYW